MKSNRGIKLKQFHYLFLLSICFFFLGGCQSSQLVGVTADVQRVISGQTIDVLIPSQSTTIERVRLSGIAAPDLQQHPWGVEAKNRLEELLSQQGTQKVLSSVVLETEDGEDRFERRLAYIWVDGNLVNEELVAHGYVLADPTGKYSQRLIHAQEYARIMEYGIWNSKRPMRLTPEEFRSNSHAST